MRTLTCMSINVRVPVNTCVHCHVCTQMCVHGHVCTHSHVYSRRYVRAHRHLYAQTRVCPPPPPHARAMTRVCSNARGAPGGDAAPLRAAPRADFGPPTRSARSAALRGRGFASRSLHFRLRRCHGNAAGLRGGGLSLGGGSGGAQRGRSGAMTAPDGPPRPQACGLQRRFGDDGDLGDEVSGGG